MYGFKEQCIKCYLIQFTKVRRLLQRNQNSSDDPMDP